MHQGNLKKGFNKNQITVVSVIAAARLLPSSPLLRPLLGLGQDLGRGRDPVPHRVVRSAKLLDPGNVTLSYWVFLQETSKLFWEKFEFSIIYLLSNLG